MKKILFGMLCALLTGYISVYAQTVDIGDDISLSYGSSHSIEANVLCVSGTVASKVERFMNDIRQHEGTGYTFSATSPFQLRALLTCYPTASTGSDLIAVTISDPVVSAGDNTSISPNTSVGLIGSVTGTPCTSFDYQWEQVSGPLVEIINSGQLMVNASTYDSASFVFPDTTENIVMKLLVTPQSCYHAGHTYSGTVTYNKLSSGGGGGGGGGISALQQEATTLFTDTGSIHLTLHVKKDIHSPFLYLYRDSIGADGHIEYVLEYSTGVNFHQRISFASTARSYSLPESLLDPHASVHYFRLKAGYLGKYSNYSPVVKYFPQDYLSVECKKNCCVPIVRFDDVFLDIDVLLEGIFAVQCTSCKPINMDKVLDQ